MQFKVPQFLDIEDKIFGPFTFKQFVYLSGGAGLCFTLYKLLGLFWGAIPILAVAGFALALTFYRPNNKPFVNMLEAGFNYLIQDKLYIWKRKKSPQRRSAEDAETLKVKPREDLERSSRLGANKLRDLAWSLDVLDLQKHQNVSDKL
ncbi:PrgI family protein [Candidatus Nomurabacteria bacterium]|nr:PrgI family protein [Candidatus Nomurabacteria bacterium]